MINVIGNKNNNVTGATWLHFVTNLFLAILWSWVQIRTSSGTNYKIMFDKLLCPFQMNIITWNIVVESIEQILIGSVIFPVVFNVDVSELRRMKKK